MPIRPELMPLYPGGSTRSPEWRELREEVLDRSGWRCDFCLVEHGMTISMLGDGTFMTGTGGVYCDRTGGFLRLSHPSFEPGRPVLIVLAVCHKDHDPTNNNPDNLLALCQKCHLRHDAKEHWRTRRARNAIGDLFDNRFATK